MKFQRADVRKFLAGKNRVVPVAAVAGVFLFLAVTILVSTQDIQPLLLMVEDSQSPPATPELASPNNNLPSEYPPLHCPTLLEDVQRNRSSIQDPNQGQVFSRYTDLPPYFQIALHNQAFDPPRWSILQWGHYYETALMTAFSQVLNATERTTQPKLPRVLDVGGNIGFFSLYAAAHGNVIVDTFEPNLINAFRMCQSLQLNQWNNEYQASSNSLSPRVNCHPYGVGKELGSLEFAESWNPGQGQFRNSGSGGEGKKIPVIPLDAFAESRGWFESRPDIAILKVDVEGYEINVVQGASRLLKSGLVRNIFTEVSARNPKEIEESTFCIGLIASAGYDVHQYGGFRGPKHAVDWSGTNVTQLAELVIHEVTKKKHKQLNLWWKLTPR